MKLQSNFLILLISFFVWTCTENKTGPYKEYTRNDEGLYFKLVALGDGEKKISTFDEITFSCKFITLRDSVFFSSHNEKLQILPLDSINTASFNHKLVGLVTGDSVSILIKPRKLFRYYFQSTIPTYCRHDSLLHLNIRINKVKKADINKPDGDMKEWLSIVNYLKNLKTVTPVILPRNIVQLEYKLNDSTNRVNYNKYVELRYYGWNLKDSLLDETFGPFKFKCGTKDQLIQGLNNVIIGMAKGETKKIILPSYMAFGKLGNSNGSIPPNTPMVYEVEILEVKNDD